MPCPPPNKTVLKSSYTPSLDGKEQFLEGHCFVREHSKQEPSPRGAEPRFLLPGHTPMVQRIRTPVFSMNIWQSCRDLEGRKARVRRGSNFALVANLGALPSLLPLDIVKTLSGDFTVSILSSFFSLLGTYLEGLMSMSSLPLNFSRILYFEWELEGARA